MTATTITAAAAAARPPPPQPPPQTTTPQHQHQQRPGIVRHFDDQPSSHARDLALLQVLVVVVLDGVE